MNPPPPTPIVQMDFTPAMPSDEMSDFEFDLPELDHDDDPYNYFSANEDAYDRRDRRIHAWLHQQCRFAFTQHGKQFPRAGEPNGFLKHKGSSRTMTTATTDDSDPELEDARADSPLLGMVPVVDKPLPSPPPATPPTHSRSASGSSNPSIQNLSRRPSLLHQPSLALLGETSVLETRNRALSNASGHNVSSPLPPSSPPTRRQSRLHTQAASISSVSSSSPHIEPHQLAHVSSHLSLSMQNPSMRHAVYIDSEEVRERLDEFLHSQAQRGSVEDFGQEIEYSARHYPQLSGGSSAGGGLFTPPPSAAIAALYQSPYPSSSQVYLGPGTPPGTPHSGRGRSDSVVQTSTINKPPTRPPPAPPLVIEPAMSDQLDASSKPNDSPYGLFYEEGTADDSLSPPAPTMSRWSLASSAMEAEASDKKEKKRKSLIGSVISSAQSSDGNSSLKEKKRSRLVSFISRLSGVGNQTFMVPGEDAPPVPSLNPSPPTTPGEGPPMKLPVDAQHYRHSEETSEIKLSGSIEGSWEPVAPSLPSKSAPSSPTASRFKTLAPPLPLPISNKPPVPLTKAASEGIVGSTPFAPSPLAITGRARSNSGAELLGLTKPSVFHPIKPSAPVSPHQFGYGVSQPARPRPTLMKSASASVLNTSSYPHPYALHQAGHGNGTPLTPSSEISTEDEYEDEDEDEDGEQERQRRQLAHEERWARASESSKAEQRPATSPSQISPPLSQSEHLAKLASALNALGPVPVIPAPLPPGPSTGINGMGPAGSGDSMLVQMQRQRLRSMSSLGNLSAAATASGPQQRPQILSPSELGSTTMTGTIKQQQKEERATVKGRGLRGLVERMGFTSGSSNLGTNSQTTSTGSTISTLSSSSFPSSPPSTFIQSQFVAGSLTTTPLATTPNSETLFDPGYSMSKLPSPPSYSPTHSPTTSLSGGFGGPSSAGGLLSTVRRKQPKRRLIISGIAEQDTHAYEAVKAWCESFGEVKEMNRTSNGSLQIDFKKASVADTVCRVQAKVYIKGAGSVALSWSTKKLK